MNLESLLAIVIAVGTILAGVFTTVNYLSSIKRKVDTDVFTNFMAEHRLAQQKIESTLEAIKLQMDRKINSEELHEMRATLKTLTHEIELLKGGK